eukprot:CAMPEP_0178458140 /NCGR_PEP_ID=MMETSP0689_2-20121128/47391_1 /TAXON_ID=160604 /ORGANISM="Amphidinium massartii, Strain CS-259" /LENGTH=108 /DNA_ID=CAMNT_0020084437 /DNA_START=67 /DNA_END=393 /DNA_ORIENTATION=-
MAQATEEKPVEEYKTLWGARILWPPDIPDNMLEDAVKVAQEAMEEHQPNIEQNAMKMAEKIKKHFDETWGPYWHITVGKNFGCHAVHEKQRFVYFYIGQFAFLMYKAQ